MNFHPRIHPVNYPLLRKLPPDHPAVRALQVHAEARDSCVGKEVDFPSWGIKGIDQVFYSEVEHREYRFSTIAYSYVSYDLFLDGWVESSRQPTESELSFLEGAPKMRALLEECEKGAQAAKNGAVLSMIAKTREFADALEHAIHFRFQTAGIRLRSGAGEELAAMRDARKAEGPQINVWNTSLLHELPPTHPAISALHAHADARRACADARESKTPGIGKEWLSGIDGREHDWNGFVREYIDRELVLDGWIERAPEATDAELSYLEEVIPVMRAELNECRQKALGDKNLNVLSLVDKATAFADALEAAILLRFRAEGIPYRREATKSATP